MTTTYAGNPAASDVAWIRFEIQDTGPDYAGDAFHFQDEEIASKLADDGGNTTLAAGHLLQVWARHLATQPDFRIGRFSESNWVAMAGMMNDKANELLAEAHAAMTDAFLGGVGETDKTTRYNKADRTRGAFRRGQFSNPNAAWGRGR